MNNDFVEIGEFCVIIGQFYDDNYWSITLDDATAICFHLDPYRRFKDKERLIKWITKSIFTACEKHVKSMKL